MRRPCDWLQPGCGGCIRILRVMLLLCGQLLRRPCMVSGALYRCIMGAWPTDPYPTASNSFSCAKGSACRQCDCSRWQESGRNAV